MFLRRLFLISFFITIFVFPHVYSENSTCYKKVCFEPEWEVGDTTLNFRGAALHEFLKLDMYTGALYVTDEVKTIEDALGDVPKVLVLHYHRGIKVKWMNRVAKHQLKKNKEINLESIEDRVDQIGAAYQKMKKNDRYALVYEPGEGTTLLFNRDPIVTIPGEDFQRAYFGIWISDYAVNKKFRDRVLGISQGGSS